MGKRPPIDAINDSNISAVYSYGATALVLPELETSNNFMKMIDTLMLEEVINSNYTQKELINNVISLFSENSFLITFSDLYNKLKNVEKEKCYCILPVYGFVVTEPVTFENVTFASGSDCISLVDEKFKIPITEKIQKPIENLSDDTVALICIKSASRKKAIEIAEEILRKYLNIFRIFIGSKNRRSNVSVENLIRYRSKVVVFTEDKITFDNQIKGAYQPVPLNDNYFITSKYISFLIKLLDVNKKKI